MSDYYGCTCMQYAPMEHLRLWRKRAAKTLQRMAARRRPINFARLCKTAHLITLVERGAPEVFLPSNMAYSHHLVGCPFKQRKHTQRTVEVAHA